MERSEFCGAEFHGRAAGLWTRYTRGLLILRSKNIWNVYRPSWFLPGEMEIPSRVSFFSFFGDRVSRQKSLDFFEEEEEEKGGFFFLRFNLLKRLSIIKEYNPILFVMEMFCYGNFFVGRRDFIVFVYYGNNSNENKNKIKELIRKNCDILYSRSTIKWILP